MSFPNTIYLSTITFIVSLSRVLAECMTDLTILSGNKDFSAGVARFGWGCVIIGTVLWILGYVFVACFNAAVSFKRRQAT